jgi:xylulokinase
MNLIGLDVGTTGCKALLFNEDGEALGSGFREYPIATDASGKAEQDADQVWGLCVEALRSATEEAVRRVGRRPDVAAIGVSTQGDAIIPLDRSGQPTAPTFLGMDYRSARQARDCAARFGAEPLYRRTGMRPHPINALCKVLWLREERPEAWARTARVATYADFVLGRLGAPGWIDETMASRTMAWDLEKRCWAEDLLAELGFSTSLFSCAIPSGTPIGRLAPSLARQLGLTGDVQLVSGAHDQAAGAVGAGALEDGDAVISTGTAEVLSTSFVSPGAPPALYAGFYPCYASALPGRRFTFTLNHVGGLLLRWYRDTWAAAEVAEAAASGRDPYEVILSGLPEGPATVLFLPHLNGAGTPTCDTGSMGAIVGLTLATRRADVVKAMLECQSYELLQNLETLTSADITVRRVTAVGGGARSPVWLQVKADVLGLPIRTVQVNEAACLGAAVLAGAGAAVYSSVAEGARRAVRFGIEYHPVHSAHAAYGQRYAIYRGLHETLRPIHARLRS